jgi:uncharacterized protein (DUF983 family)
MEKKPLTMKQKYKIFNIGRIISYALLIFGFLMDGFANPMTWVGIVLVIAVSIYRVLALRCPECDELIVSNFGFMTKRCEKCGWKLDQEDEPKDENA